MRIVVVRSNLCATNGFHSELLRSDFLVLSIHMHTTSSTEVRTLGRLRICINLNTVVYTVLEACFVRVFFDLTTIIYGACPIDYNIRK